MGGIPIIFVAVVCFILLGWTVFIGCIARVTDVRESGFSLRTTFRRTYHLEWSDVRAPAQRFDSFFPRLVLKRRVTGLLTIWDTFIVPIQTDAVFLAFVDLLEKRVGVSSVSKLSDL